jgi:hypothetical protein
MFSEGSSHEGVHTARAGLIPLGTNEGSGYEEVN